MIFGISDVILKQSAHRSRQITTPTPNHIIFYRLHAPSDALATMSKHSRHGSRHGNLIENFLYHYNLRSVVCFCKLCMISVKVVTNQG